MCTRIILFWVRQSLNTDSYFFQKGKVWGKTRGGTFLSSESVSKYGCRHQHLAINQFVLEEYPTLSGLWKWMFPGKCACLRPLPALFNCRIQRNCISCLVSLLEREKLLNDKMCFELEEEGGKVTPQSSCLALFQYQFMLMALFLQSQIERAVNEA